MVDGHVVAIGSDENNGNDASLGHVCVFGFNIVSCQLGEDIYGKQVMNWDRVSPFWLIDILLQLEFHKMMTMVQVMYRLLGIRWKIVNLILNFLLVGDGWKYYWITQTRT